MLRGTEVGFPRRGVERAAVPRPVYLYLQTPVSSRSRAGGWLATSPLKLRRREFLCPKPVPSRENERASKQANSRAATLIATIGMLRLRISSTNFPSGLFAQSYEKSTARMHALSLFHSHSHSLSHSYRHGLAGSKSPPRSARRSPRGCSPTPSSQHPSSPRELGCCG